MLDDIGRELRTITLDMLVKLESALNNTGITCYNVDKAAGTISVIPSYCSRVIRRVVIRPQPVTMSVTVTAERADNSICAYRFRWRKHPDRDLSKAVRKVLTGG